MRIEFESLGARGEYRIKDVSDYNHGGLYIYDGTSQTFDKFVPRPESWATWAGRVAANGVVFGVFYQLLKWWGIIVTVQVAS
jgi:hypothetical protein